MSTISARLRGLGRTVALLVMVAGVGPSALGQSSPSFRVAQTPQAPQVSGGDTSSEPPPPADAPMTPVEPNPIDLPTSPFSLATDALTSRSTANLTWASLGAYIDSAIPRTMSRTRYDTAGGANHPERAEFFWPQYGPNFSGSFSFQQIDNYFEYAPTGKFSAFIDAPVRFVHLPQGNGASTNFGGFSDLTFGTKYAFVARPEAFYTFQFQMIAPTGDARRGLGTGHPSLEPCLLAFRQVTERFFLVGQFCDWIPVGGPNFNPSDPKNPGLQAHTPNFAGNVLNYGVGGIYNAVVTERFRFAPTVEFVGWTVLGGRTGVGQGNLSESAAGQTIANAKVGARFALGDYLNPGGVSPLNDRVSLYAGYSRSLTGDVWYKNLFRIELSIFF